MSDIQLKSATITAVGSALVDLLIHEDDAFLNAINKEKGGMTLVEDHEIQYVLSKSGQEPQVVPGGSACNTICGVAELGGKSGFIAKRGNDDFGENYETYLRGIGVIPCFYRSDTPTGRVLSIITPDAQRSMFTHLGASVELHPEEIQSDLFKDSGIVILEGYLLFNRELMRASLDAAKTAGALIALDLASYEVVQGSKDILGGIIKNDVDILIANEDEAAAYTGVSDEMVALEKMSEHVKIAVLKVGARGSYISHKGKVIQITPDGHARQGDFLDRMEAADSANIKDTTGAGDLWAAGFLYGIANGYSMEASGRIGAACGFEVCQVVGAQIPKEGWDRIKALKASLYR